MSLGHKTPLGQHLKSKELWVDLSVLLIIWLLSYLLSEYVTKSNLSYVTKLMQITALMASIEFMGFISLHLFGLRKGLYIQGFLGGLISSTMVFIQMGDADKNNFYNKYQIISSLLLSIIAMLCLAETIIITLAESSFVALSLPIFLQILTLIICLFYFRLKNQEDHSQKQSIVIIDDPIVWKNVLKFTLILSVILLGVKTLYRWAPQSYLISTLVISFFETHAVLAAYLSGSDYVSYGPEVVVLIILLGNVISKIFLTLRSSIREIKAPVIFSLILSYLAALLSLI